MKILIPLATDFGKHGGFRVISQLANNWIKQGHQVSFLVYHKFNKPYFPTQAEFIFYNSFGKVVDKICSDRLLFGPIQLQFALKKALDTLDFDIVLATQCFSAEPVAKSSITAKKYYYIQAYEPEYYNDKGIKNFLYRRMSKRSYQQNLIHIVNSEMYFDYKEIKASKCVYPGIDLHDFSPKQNQFISEKIILGTIGRIEKLKGTSDVIESFIYLRKLYGDKVELHIAFGNPEWGNLPGVKFLIPENDHKLAEYYRSIDIYICAGKYQLDAIHYPVIEAMSCNTTVVTTGYYPADAENSYMVNMSDPQNISKKIVSIMNDTDEAKIKSKIALGKVFQFDWKVVSGKMIKYFEE